MWPKRPSSYVAALQNRWRALLVMRVVSAWSSGPSASQASALSWKTIPALQAVIANRKSWPASGEEPRGSKCCRSKVFIQKGIYENGRNYEYYGSSWRERRQEAKHHGRTGTQTARAHWSAHDGLQEGARSLQRR